MTSIKVNIPENKIGNWSIKKYEAKIKDIYSLFCSDRQMKKIPDEPFGFYTALIHDTYKLSMIDSEFFYNQHIKLKENAKGNILIGGLGIGFDNEIIMTMNNVQSVTIIENSQEIIDLVWPYCKKDDRFTLIYDDIFTWNIPENSHWDYMWSDVYIPLMYPDFKEHARNIVTKYSPYCDQIDFWPGIKGK